MRAARLGAASDKQADVRALCACQDAAGKKPYRRMEEQPILPPGPFFSFSWPLSLPQSARRAGRAVPLIAAEYHILSAAADTGIFAPEHAAFSGAAACFVRRHLLLLPLLPAYLAVPHARTAKKLLAACPADAHGGIAHSLSLSSQAVQSRFQPAAKPES